MGMEARRNPPALEGVPDPFHHGDERRAWSREFITYAYTLVDKPAYAGMPATRDDEGKLDWTIPSNRQRGSKNWEGNRQRREWWAGKARSLGIPIEGSWLSKTARLIQPWGWKPCQTCGRWMRLSYAYPTRRTVDALNESLPEDQQLEYLELLDIYEVAEQLVEVTGLDQAAEALVGALPTMEAANPSSTEELLAALEDHAVSVQPRGRLSPGVMSNAPDRLDGFHTYNLCCRSAQDTGRTRENLKTYATDRRAFEHWAEGDWASADLLMAMTVEGHCPRCGTFGKLSADHIGPISLGFKHIPFFEPLCRGCNSAKNNRLSLSDVAKLKAYEADHGSVVSWQAETLWTQTSPLVKTDEDALRLSRLMVVNQHGFLRLLGRALEQGLPDVLMQFLSPHWAETRPEFVGLDRLSLRFSTIDRSPRQTTYAVSKASRMIRIALEALLDYQDKENRNVASVPETLLEDANGLVADALERALRNPSSWRGPLTQATMPDVPTATQFSLIRNLVTSGSYRPDVDFSYVREAFQAYMQGTGNLLARRVEDEHAIKDWEAAPCD